MSNMAEGLYLPLKNLIFQELCNTCLHNSAPCENPQEFCLEGLVWSCLVHCSGAPSSACGSERNCGAEQGILADTSGARYPTLGILMKQK